MTEFLNQNEIGNQYLINSMILWFSLVLINPIGMFVNRHLHEWRSQKIIWSVILQLNKYFIFVALLAVPILFLVQKLIGIASQIETVPLIIYAVIYIYLSTWFQTIVSFLNLFDFQKEFVIINVLSQSLGLLFSVLLGYCISPNVFSWLFGLLGGQVFALLIAIMLIKKNILNDQIKTKSLKLRIVFSKQTFYFCYPIAITTLFMWFLSQGYRIVVENELGSVALASLGVGLGIAASVSSIVESITTQYFYPGYYKSLENSQIDSRRAAWLKLWKSAISVYIPCFFLTISTAPFLVKILVSSKFFNIVPYVIMGALFEFFRQVSNILYIVSHAEKKTKNTIMPYLVGAVVLSGSIFLMKKNQFVNIDNILKALCLASFVTFLYNYQQVKKMICIQFDFKFFIASISICTPVLVVFMFNTLILSTGWLFLISSLCGVWILFSIFVLFRKMSTK